MLSTAIVLYGAQGITGIRNMTQTVWYLFAHGACGAWLGPENCEKWFSSSGGFPTTPHACQDSSCPPSLLFPSVYMYHHEVALVVTVVSPLPHQPHIPSRSTHVMARLVEWLMDVLLDGSLNTCPLETQRQAKAASHPRLIGGECGKAFCLAQLFLQMGQLIELSFFLLLGSAPEYSSFSHGHYEPISSALFSWEAIVHCWWQWEGNPLPSIIFGGP